MFKIIAVGNLLMKDDGTAIRVIEKIKAELEKNNVKIIMGETDIEYCISMLEEGDFVIIVDAARNGKQPGEFSIFDIERFTKDRRIKGQHELSIIDSIKMHFKKIKGYIIGIEVSEVEFGEDLSEAIVEKFDKICVGTLECIQNLITVER